MSAKATAQSLLSTSAVTLSGSAFRSGADPGRWDQLAFAPLTCLLFAASLAATGLGMDWTLEASENLDAPPRHGRYQTTFDPGWAAAAAWTGDRLFEARVRAVLNMDAKQRDSVKMTVTKVLTAWLLTPQRDRRLLALEMSFLDDCDATLFQLTPADGTMAAQAIVLMADSPVLRTRGHRSRRRCAAGRPQSRYVHRDRPRCRRNPNDQRHTPRTTQGLARVGVNR